MNEDKNEVNVLDELNKGACMGQDAIDFIMDKVEDKKLKEVLEKQYSKNEKKTKEIRELYSEYNEKKPHETSGKKKEMTRYGIEMRTMTDDTTSKLAELLMQGTNMGIIEGRRLLNHKTTDENVHRLVQEYVDMQEEAVENLKQFL